MGDAEMTTPTSRVVKATLELDVHMGGDLRASRQEAVTAPPVGGSLRILSLVDAGAFVKQGDVLVSFDPADQRYALEQAESELLEADQNILKRVADTGAQAASDQVALLTARFNVRRAELDAVVDRDLHPRPTTTKSARYPRRKRDGRSPRPSRICSRGRRSTRPACRCCRRPV